jgi:hypothetical protein
LVSYSGRTPTFCVFPVFSVAVMEKCCDACGDGEYYLRSGISTLQGDGVLVAPTALTYVDEIYGWLMTVGKTPDFVCNSCV